MKGTPSTQLVDGAIPGLGGPVLVGENEAAPLEETTFLPFGEFQREVLGESFSCDDPACRTGNNHLPVRFTTHALHVLMCYHEVHRGVIMPTPFRQF